jgi:hypothetical protein
MAFVFFADRPFVRGLHPSECTLIFLQVLTSLALLIPSHPVYNQQEEPIFDAAL